MRTLERKEPQVDDIVRINPPLDGGLPYEFWQVSRFREDGLLLIIPARKDGRPCSMGQVARYMTWTSPANLTVVETQQKEEQL